MIKIKELTVKNFMSIGNATQAINFDRKDLTLVLGENLDLVDEGERNGTGKAQPLYSKIKIPNGWTTMGEINIGDSVTTPNGEDATVTGVFPQGHVDTYRIYFSDGRYTDACKDHLWKIYSHSFKHSGKNNWKILSTTELIEHNKKYKDYKNKSTYYKYVPLIIPRNDIKSELPLNPYFLGAMLGDGGMTKHGIGFTTADIEMFENMKQVLPENYQMTKNRTDKYGYGFSFIKRKKYSTLRLALTDLNLYGSKSGTKFIPLIYKNASTDQKIELIQGLVDTDGYVAKNNGALTITTVSKQMATDIQEIIQSIGGIAKISVKTNCGYKKDNRFIPCQDAYTVSIMYHTPKKLAKLTRKKDLLPGENYQYKNRKLRIDKIEYIGKINSQCIMIDHDDHLYITDNYIVTHNTTLINALSFALYGSALSNIKLNNLVNKSNGKNMLVSINFTVNDVDYRIERGRKPNLLKFYKNDIEQKDDDAQGENRETQKEIDHLLGLSHAMFSHTVALNTYTTPFLSMRAADQKNIIEQLLGITILSEKAEALKVANKITKTNIAEEEFRLETIVKANNHIKDQISNLERRQRVWIQSHNDKIAEYTNAIELLLTVNIEKEINSHNTNTDNIINTDKENVKRKAEAEKHNAGVELLISENKTAIEKYNNSLRECNRWISSIEKDRIVKDKRMLSLENDIKLINDHKCHACGQELHDAKHEEIKTTTEKLLTDIALEILAGETQEMEHLETISKLGTVPVTIKPQELKIAIFADSVSITTFYQTLKEAHEHKSSLETLSAQLETALVDTDPYIDQINDMLNDGMQEVNYDKMNIMTELQDHQVFLLKLLTSKDSFIRKKIIEQNLAYLNNRLTHYLRESGLPHSVKFMSDLSVEITEMGMDLDFDNLSRGERTRLILSLSLTFRDVWESLYNHINLLFVDELIDSGLDSAGVECSIKIMKKLARERGKSVWVVSHRDELISRVHNTMKVVKSGGFTEYHGHSE